MVPGYAEGAVRLNLDAGDPELNAAGRSADREVHPLGDHQAHPGPIMAWAAPAETSAAKIWPPGWA
jgi:hypothetical protein